MEDEQRLRLLEAKVSDLQRQVEFLLKITGLDLSALRSAPDDELLRCYQDAVQLLGVSPKKIPPEVCERWSPLFVQLSEYEMTRLQGIVGYDHTWEPFYHLCVKMMTAVRQHKDFGKDVGMQHLYAFLERGRREMRTTAVIMIKKYPDNLPKKAKTLLKDDDLSTYF